MTAGTAGKIRAIGLDLMSTILYDPYREALVAATGMALEELRPLRAKGVWEAFERGEIDEAEYARRFFREETGRTLDLGRFVTAMRAGYCFLPGMEEALEELSLRFPLHVLSNYPPWYEDIRRALALDRFLTGHHVSYRLGTRKPAADFYEKVLRATGLAPHEMLFVDDRDDNCAAAAALGMRIHRFEDADVLLAFVRKEESLM